MGVPLARIGTTYPRLGIRPPPIRERYGHGVLQPARSLRCYGASRFCWQLRFESVVSNLSPLWLAN